MLWRCSWNSAYLAVELLVYVTYVYLTIIMKFDNIDYCPFDQRDATYSISYDLIVETRFLNPPPLLLRLIIFAIHIYLSYGKL